MDTSVYGIFALLFCCIVCTVPSSNGASVGQKIYNGQPAKRNEFPWVGHVWPVVDCGAVLVSPILALTTALCAGQIPPGSEVVFGDFNLTTSSDREVSVLIKSKLYHPSFISGGINNNIALLELQEPGYRKFIGSRRIKVVPNLADKRTQRRVLRKGIQCTATGYGMDKDPHTGYWEYPAFLNKIAVKYVSDEECRATGIPLAENTICQGAVQEYGGSCYGDEGSATMCELDGKIYMVSMLSYFNRLDGCLVGFRQETAIAPFRKWLLQNIRRKQ